jgi:hypothetical protein
VAGHIFQARPVWIYTQSNITSIIFTWVHNTSTEKNLLLCFPRSKLKLRHYQLSWIIMAWFNYLGICLMAKTSYWRYDVIYGEGSPNPLANKDSHRSIFTTGHGLPGPYSLADLDRGEGPFWDEMLIL